MPVRCSRSNSKFFLFLFFCVLTGHRNCQTSLTQPYHKRPLAGPHPGSGAEKAGVMVASKKAVQMVVHLPSYPLWKPFLAYICQVKRCLFGVKWASVGQGVAPCHWHWHQGQHRRDRQSVAFNMHITDFWACSPRNRNRRRSRV
jgi:hypothetical protein